MKKTANSSEQSASTVVGPVKRRKAAKKHQKGPKVTAPSLAKKKETAKSKVTNLRHRTFCELYALEMDFMGNATRAYAIAFDIDLDDKEVYKKSYASCRAQASEILTKANILAYINELLDDYCLNDIQVDKQLAYVIFQHTDLKAKIAGIKEYNALKRRIVRKMELTGKDGKPIPLAIVDFRKAAK